MAELEHDFVIIPLDQNYEAAVKKFQNDGWLVAAGFTPFAVFPLVRQKGMQPMQAQGANVSLKIDDSQVQVMRKGPDGVLRPVNGQGNPQP